MSEEIRAQIEAQAMLNAKEFANRQILLKGNGAPQLQAPIGIEYEDHSVNPTVRYRKVGINANDWKELKEVKIASKEEVYEGVDQQKLITPYSLNERLNLFTQSILNLPTAELQERTSKLIVEASNSFDQASFSISIPTISYGTFFPIEIIAYGLEAKLTQLMGGEIGQLITLRRGEAHSMEAITGQYLRLSAHMSFNDAARNNQLSLQKVEEEVWVEVLRKEF